MATLSVSALLTDFSSTVLSNITTLDFIGNPRRSTAVFSASQFDNVQISSSLIVDGGTGTNTVTVIGGNIDALAWTFANWSIGDVVSLTGSASGNRLNGSTQADRISGLLGNDSINGASGDDTLIGNEGDDQFLYTASSAQGFETIDGGADTDSIVASGGGTCDFRNFTISNVERLTLISASGQTLLASGQIGGAAGTIANLTGSSAVDRIQVNGPSIDIHGLTFTNWTAGTDVVTLILTAGGTAIGSDQNDTFADFGQGLLNLQGGLGDDIFRFTANVGSSNGDSLDGGGGTDAIELNSINTGIFDFASLGALTGVEKLTFGASNAATASFIAATISGFSMIEGSAHSHLRVLVTSVGGGFDASALTFVNWTGLDDIVEIQGNLTDNVLTGMAHTDSIAGFDGNDRIEGGQGGDTLDGGLGTDTLVYSGPLGVMINLGTNFASGGDAQADVISGFEAVSGGSGNDDLQGSVLDNRLIGNGGTDILKGSDGSDTLNGGGADDTLIGGLDRDSFTGGTGKDTFVFLAVNDSAVGSPRDVISDFVQGQDKINLAGIDAIAGGVDDAFVFRGTAGFGVSAGLRFINTATTTVVFADVNSDQVADFQIALQGVFTLVATDFAL